MFAKTQTQDKTAWKIISDPIVEERQWMAAATVVGDKAPPAARPSVFDKLPDAAHSFLSGITGLVVSMGMFFISFTMINSIGAAMGIDDQFTTFSDWLSAVFLLIGVPVMGAAFHGYVHRVNAQELKHAWLLPTIPWVVLGVLANTQHGLGVFVFLALGILLSRLSFCLAREVAAWWHRHKCPLKLAGPQIPVLVLASTAMWISIVHYVSTPDIQTPHEQLAQSSAFFGVAFAATLSAAAGLISSVLCGSKQLGTRMAAAMTMQAPLMLFYLASLIAGLVYAIYTAFTGAFDGNVLLISTIALALTTASTSGGAAFGHLLRKRN